MNFQINFVCMRFCAFLSVFLVCLFFGNIQAKEDDDDANDMKIEGVIENPNSFYEEIANCSQDSFIVKENNEEDYVESFIATSSLSASNADLHAFKNLKDAQKYNEMIKRVFSRIRLAIDWEFFSGRDILIQASQEKKTAQFLEKKARL